MRGKPEQQLGMLTSLSAEDLIPKDHPIRRIRKVIDDVLVEIDGELDAMYSRIGRPSVPPEQLLKATILMALYSVRSERAFCERLNYDLLFKWFLDLPIDAKAFDPTTFTKNRDRLLEHDIADRFFAAVVGQRSCAATCRANTSRSTGPCWRRGRRTRASNPKTVPADRVPVAAATSRSTSTVRSAATRPIARPPIPKHCWPASRRAPRLGSVTRGIC
jgi:transposase